MNAVVQKDYASANPIQISVYPDRLLVWNPGQLPQDWTVERLLEKHPSQPFNPDIANSFSRAGLVEAWGRGVERMLSACRDADMALPRFQVEVTGHGVEFDFGEVFSKPISSDRLGEKLRENDSAIIAMMREQPTVSAKALAQTLGISATAFEKNIQFLEENGYIQRIGPARGGLWEVLIRE